MDRRKFLVGCVCCGAAAASVSAFAQEAHAPGLSLSPLGDGVWLHRSWKFLADGRPFPSNGLVIKGGRRTLLIDTTWPVADMGSLLDQIERLAPGAPIVLACTHAHDDRMSGVEIARARGVHSLVHVLTQEDAPARGLPLADETWRGRRKTLRLGGRSVELFYPGPAHTRDNIVAFLDDAGILFGGCMLRNPGFGIGNIADADLGAYANSVRNVIARYGDRARTIVPGHGDAGGPEILQHTLSLAMAASAR